jgi:hypothetical protein
MRENPKTLPGDHLPVPPPPLGVATPLFPTITEATPSLINISIVCSVDVPLMSIILHVEGLLKFEKSK